MHEISLDELDDLSTEVEAAVDATALIDRWCSGPDWQIPVATAFAPDAERLLLATDDHDGFALLAKYHDEQEAVLFGGVEPLWGFGTPIVGVDPHTVATEVAAVLAERSDWRALYLAGMPLVDERSPVGHRPTGDETPAVGHRARPSDRSPGVAAVQPDPTVTLGIAYAMSSLGRVGFAEGITRQIADLAGGYDRWLGRRSARFRRNLRQAAAKADLCGLRIVDVSTEPALIDRLMSIEHRSWKGLEGSGITSSEMTTMYGAMIERLRLRGRLHAHVALLDGLDVGYILGGVRGRRYRGLQLSYIDEARHLSVGNLLQDHQLRELDRLDLADLYDLGMDFAYKRRWADRAETSLTVVVHRR